jgi:hypothetical protein
MRYGRHLLAGISSIECVSEQKQQKQWWQLLRRVDGDQLWMVYAAAASFVHLDFSSAAEAILRGSEGGMGGGE